MKARYFGETLGEDNIREVLFEDLKKDDTVGLAIYIRNYVSEASRRTGTFITWDVKFLKDHTISIRRFYPVKEIYRFYKL